MRINLFEASRKRSQLEQNINECIHNINRLTKQADGEEQLFNYLNLMEKYTHKEGYAKLPAELRRQVRSTLRELKKQLTYNLAIKVEQQNQPLSPYLVQIPSSGDLDHMQGMLAGGKEDQKQRLTRMNAVIRRHSKLPIITTDSTQMHEHWVKVFQAVDSGVMNSAIDHLHQIPAHDVIMQSLLCVHSPAYLQSIIANSIEAQQQGIITLDNDILITPKTFEILIKDIATTLFSPAKIILSFGLPSHHAYATEGSGFCILNKTAILLAQAQLTAQKPIQHFIIGTDVNRDNGLSAVLKSSTCATICHIDIFDSKVYPQDNIEAINASFRFPSEEIQRTIHCWKQNQLSYFAVDLSTNLRQDKALIHPALIFALEQLEQCLAMARMNEHQVMIYLPTGWDSHVDETAYCGKFIDGKMMAKTTAYKYRFTNKDLSYFYEHLWQLYLKNEDHIDRIYWGLEGGYNQKMYEQQVQLLLDTAAVQLLQPEPLSNTPEI